jgi:hypothetical protein
LSRIVTHGPLWEQALVDIPAKEFHNIGMTFVASNPRECRGHDITRTLEHLNKQISATDESARNSVSCVVFACLQQNSGQG